MDRYRTDYPSNNTNSPYMGSLHPQQSIPRVLLKKVVNGVTNATGSAAERVAKLFTRKEREEERYSNRVMSTIPTDLYSAVKDLSYESAIEYEDNKFKAPYTSILTTYKDVFSSDFNFFTAKYLDKRIFRITNESNGNTKIYYVFLTRFDGRNQVCSIEEFNKAYVKTYNRIIGNMGRVFHHENFMTNLDVSLEEDEVVTGNIIITYLKTNGLYKGKGPVHKAQKVVKSMLPFSSNSSRVHPSPGGGKKATKLPKKEILGKLRCIYKVPGSKKDHIKHKGMLITVTDYKKHMKLKAKAKPKAKKIR
jgi:hypothetical protein